MSPIVIKAYACECALGRTKAELKAHLTSLKAPFMYERTGYLSNGQSLMLGGVDGPLPAIPEELSAHNSRNNQLLLSCLKQIAPELSATLEQVGTERFGIVMGTSTSGLDEADHKVSNPEDPRWRYPMQELGDPSRFIQRYLQTTGPAYTISTACSSSARAVITAIRMLHSGLCDAVLCGGADTLCRMPINGFKSLELVSDELCAPFAAERKGITIGEGVGLMLLTTAPQKGALSSQGAFSSQGALSPLGALSVVGYGESSDAYHVSAPEPEGKGAERAMRMALEHAHLSPNDLGYINLHGTASVMNDQAEACVMHRVFGHSIPCSSTKYLTGHTLGASGIVELCLCALTLEENLPLVPQDFSHNHLDEKLPDCGLLTTPGTHLKSEFIMTNAFAFGGNNTSLIIKRSA